MFKDTFKLLKINDNEIKYLSFKFNDSWAVVEMRH